MELVLVHMIAKQKAEMHLDFIKTNGEKGRSAIADMAAFEYRMSKSGTALYVAYKGNLIAEILGINVSK